MDELTRTLAPLVEHPPATPTDLDVLVRRATARRRVRWAATTVTASITVAGAALAVTTFGPVGTPTVDPVGGPPAVAPADPTPQDRATDEPTPPDPDGDALDGPTAPPVDAVPQPDAGSTTAPEPGPSEPAPADTGDAPEPHADARAVEWVDDEGRIAWQVANGRDGGWIAGYFRTREAVALGTDEPPVKFWTRVSDEGEDHPREDLLKMALEMLTSRPPEGYDSAVAGADLRLTSAVLDGTWLAVDHPDGTVLTDNDYGSAGAAEFAYQYLAVLQHYYPEAETVCVSIDGVESREDGPYILHDGVGCPWSLR